MSALGMTDRFARIAVVGKDPIAVHEAVHAELVSVLATNVAEPWDVECVATTVAAAAAEACRLGLDRETASRAVSIAATQASGLAGLADHWLGDYQLNESLHRGQEAARLAAAGMTAPTTGLEGRRGLVALLAPGVRRGSEEE